MRSSVVVLCLHDFMCQMSYILYTSRGAVLLDQLSYSVYENHATNNAHYAPVVDPNDKVLTSEHIDVPSKAGLGFHSYTVPEDVTTYNEDLKHLDRRLVRFGVTSYLVTVPSQTPQVYC